MSDRTREWREELCCRHVVENNGRLRSGLTLTLCGLFPWGGRAIVTLCLLSGLAAFAAQNSSGDLLNLIAGKRIFSAQCAPCHGSNAQGADQGPPLAGNRWVRSRSIARLRNLIHAGIPQSGMPAFNLPSQELAAVAAFVHSLNAPAAESSVPGDAGAGRQFFFGKGRCASCHIIQGRGSPIGPDLSDTGREMTVDEIRRALLHPETHITPGYDLVAVELKSGRTLRGFARDRGNFDLQLQDLQGRFHLLLRSQISAVQDLKGSPMPPAKGNTEEMQNLVAYLSGLTGVKPGATISTPTRQEGAISFSQILNPRPGDWPTYNGNLSGNRYSALKQINTRNVERMVAKWIFSIPHFGLEVTPVVSKGVMYVTGANQAFALDARTGHSIWEYCRPRTPGLAGDASLGTNRGVAILGDKVFMVTDNAHLLALNRITGRPVWEAVIPDEPMHYGGTSAPLIVNNLVIIGVSGADEGIRGFISAYRADTGERVWRTWTVPKKGEPGADTWGGDPLAMGGGSTWLTGSFDPETDTLFWPTGNPFPDGDGRNRPGDNLYTDCILALNPANGRLKWYYQFTPHDLRDWDAAEPAVLVDTRYRGANRKLLLHADRNGFFYVLDRTNGHVLLAKKFLRNVNWASGIGPDGRPQILPGYVPPPAGEITCPSSATNWMATAFNPVMRLYYVMAREGCSFDVAPGHWVRNRPLLPPPQKFLRALNIETGRAVWEIPLVGPADGKRWAGVLATAGGLIFYGNPSGDVVAASETDGRPLWHFPTNERMKASPMTYEVNGKQFVALAAGPNILSFALP
jgi:PQQ-dependent dehydrogenase (methanol/ethanol family)